MSPLYLFFYIIFARSCKGESPRHLRDTRSYALSRGAVQVAHHASALPSDLLQTRRLHSHSEAHLRHLQWLFRAFTSDTADDTNGGIIHTALQEIGTVTKSGNGDIDPLKAEAIASNAFVKALKAEKSKEQEQALSNPVAVLPPETVLDESDLEVPEAPAQDELQDKIDYWDAQNVTNQWLKFVKEISPPINSTKGINDVTAKFQALLSEEARDAIVYATPDLGTNDFWQATAEAWRNYLASSRAIKDNSVAKEFVDPVRTAAGIYNDYALWRYEAPWSVYDAKVQAKEQVTQPIRDEREAWIAKRDELLAAKIDHSKAFWEPHVVAAAATQQQVQQAVDAKNEVMNDFILHEYGTALTAIRTHNDVKYLLRTIGKSITIICFLNPECCDDGDVYRCPPTSLDPGF